VTSPDFNEHGDLPAGVYRVVKSVHIQAFGFPNNPVGETAWMQAQADRYGYPHGIVAFANLSDPNVEDTLHKHCAYANVRGVRMPLNYDKVSGIGCVFQRADSELIKRYLRQAVAIFGPSRCLFGSNCPPDTLFYTFDALLAAYMDAFADLTAGEQHALFCGNAERVYRL
jgi:predicted TIM-barrel fold metal-dependent hydrolase